MKIYKIKRLSDGKLYRGRGKFTKHGSYFRLEQIEKSISWVINKYPEELELISYIVEEQGSINIDKEDPEKTFEVIERDKKIDQLLNDK